MELLTSESRTAEQHIGNCLVLAGWIWIQGRLCSVLGLRGMQGQQALGVAAHASCSLTADPEHPEEPGL